MHHDGERSEKQFGMTKFLSLRSVAVTVTVTAGPAVQQTVALRSLLALPSACAGVHASTSEG